MKKQTYLVLEGPGCAGKGTQMVLVKEYLEGLGLKVETTREPGGPEAAEAIRNEIFSLKTQGVLSKEDEMWMFYVARGYNMEWVEEKFSAGADVVLKDRDYMSTFFYQAESGNPLSFVAKYHQELYQQRYFREPDLRMVLLPSEGEMERRLRTRGVDDDAFDRDLLYAKAVRGRYAELGYDLMTGKGGIFKENTVVIPADGSIEGVNASLIAKVNEVLDVSWEGREGKIGYVSRGIERG